MNRFAAAVNLLTQYAREDRKRMIDEIHCDDKIVDWTKQEMTMFCICCSCRHWLTDETFRSRGVTT